MFGTHSMPSSGRRARSAGVCSCLSTRCARTAGLCSSVQGPAAVSACSKRPRCRRPLASDRVRLWRSWRAAGDRALGRLRPTTNDVVIGVSASGVTPFVRGALVRARRAGAHVMGITCSAGSDMRELVDLLVELNVGPEVIAGSTRLKAGTATKVALNLLTTSAMIRIGKTYGNLMVDVQANSAKLRDRGTRIVSTMTGLGYVESRRLLRRAKWNVKTAIIMHKRRLTYGDAQIRLRAAGDSIRRALVTTEERRPRRRI